MRTTTFNAILRKIEEATGPPAPRLYVVLRHGVTYNADTFAFHEFAGDGCVELRTDDQPPLFIELDSVVAVGVVG